MAFASRKYGEWFRLLSCKPEFSDVPRKVGPRLWHEAIGEKWRQFARDVHSVEIRKTQQGLEPQLSGLLGWQICAATLLALGGESGQRPVALLEESEA